MISNPQNLSSSDEDEIVRKQFDQFAYRMRVACPGIIRQFDRAKQTAKIELCIMEDYWLKDQFKTEAIHLLEDVPIIFPRAGGFVLTFPVKPNDECLVIFADCCIDAWYSSGGIQPQQDKRRHDLSDGFAIIGPWNQRRVINNYHADNVQLRDDNGHNFIEIDPAENIKINAVNNVTVFCDKAYVTAETSAEINSKDVTIAGSDIVNIDSGTQVTVTSPLVDLKGVTTITGNCTITGGSITLSPSSGSTSMDGKNFLGHTHTAPAGGGQTSGVN